MQNIMVIPPEEPCCSCTDCDLSDTCQCPCICRNNLGLLYNESDQLIPLVRGLQFDSPIYECNHSHCKNSVTARSPTCKLVLRQALEKGLGVFAEDCISRGTYICQYDGNILDDADADQKLMIYDRENKGHALLIVNLSDGQGNDKRLNVDGTSSGSIARFLNHSCDGGNVQLMLVYRRGLNLPALAFFATKDIGGGEELTFAYGDPNPGPLGSACHCGTASCLGFLPLDDCV